MKAVCALVLICMLGVQGMPNPRLLRLLSLYKYNKEHGSGNHDHGEHCSGEHGSGSYGSGDHDHGEHGSGLEGSGLEGSGSEGSGDHDHSERDGGSYGSGSYGSGSYGSGSMGGPRAGGSMGGSMGGSHGSGSMGVPPAGGSMGGSMGVPAGGSMGGSMGVPPAGGSMGGSYGSGSMGGSMGVPPAGGSMGGLYGSGSMGVPPAGGSMGGPPMEPGLNAVMEQISNEFHALLDQYNEYMDKKLWEVPAFIPVQIAVHGVDLLDALNPACRKQFILDHLTGLTILALEMEKVDVGDKLVQFIESSPALSSAPVRDPAQAIRTGFQAVVGGVLDKIEEMKEEYGIVPTARIMQEGIEQLLSLPHEQLTVGALIEVFTGKILEHHLQLVERPCEDQDVVESFIGKLHTLAPEFTSEAVFSKLEEPLSSVLTGLDETHDGQITDLLNLFVVDFLQKVDEFMGALAEGDEPTLTLSFSMLGDLLTNIISAILEDGQYDFLQDYVEASVLQTVGAAIASPIDVEEMQALFLESFLKKLGEAGVDHATLSAALTTSFLETVSRLPVPQSIPVPL